MEPERQRERQLEVVVMVLGPRRVHVLELVVGRWRGVVAESSKTYASVVVWHCDWPHAQAVLHWKNQGQVD